MQDFNFIQIKFAQIYQFCFKFRPNLPKSNQFCFQKICWRMRLYLQLLRHCNQSQVYRGGDLFISALKSVFWLRFLAKWKVC